MKEKVIIKSSEEYFSIVETRPGNLSHAVWGSVRQLKEYSLDLISNISEDISSEKYYYYREVATPMDFDDIVKLDMDGARSKKQHGYISYRVDRIDHREELIEIDDRWYGTTYFLSVFDSYTLNGKDFLPLTK